MVRYASMFCCLNSKTCVQLPRKMAPWSGMSLKKWVKERRQKRKEHARLHRAEIHAAVSVAGVAAVLAAIAAENALPAGSAGIRETTVASAAALVSEQCAKVAEAAGATRDQVSAAVDATRASTDAGNVFTLTAAAATCMTRLFFGLHGSHRSATHENASFFFGKITSLLA
jgi:hypothetical protein